jgi:hypothetical protein
MLSFPITERPETRLNMYRSECLPRSHRCVILIDMNGNCHDRVFIEHDAPPRLFLLHELKERKKWFSISWLV